MSDISILDHIPLAMLKISAQLFSHQKLLILIYHRVPSTKDDYLLGEYEKSVFEKQMNVLSRYYNCISLEEGLTGLMSGGLRRHSVCVTFDDGYADNFLNASPILKKYDIPATIFIATGYLNNGMMWNDKIIEYVRNTEIDTFTYMPFDIIDYNLNGQEDRLRLIRMLIGRIKYLPFEERDDVLSEILPIFSITKDITGQMMSEDQVAELESYNVHVGAHTVSHPILAKVDDKKSLEEMVDSRDYLESIIGYKPNYFAYPNGIPGIDYTQRDVENVKKAGFSAAVSTNRGVCTKNSDIYQLPRLASWGDSLIKYSARISKEYII